MNCQEITRILDDGDIGRMKEEERGGVEVHLAACPGCADEWRIHRRLAGKVAPPVPPGLAVRCRELVAAGPAGNGRRGLSRAILFSSILAVAAAAAMVGVHQTAPSAGQSAPAADVAATLAPASVGTVTPVVPVVVTQSSAGLPSAAAMSAPQSKTLSQQKGFTVRLLPLDATGAAASEKAVLERYYNAFVQKLRTVPGLALLTPESSGYAGAVDFEIAIMHRAKTDGAQMVEVRSRSLQSATVLGVSLESRTGRGPEAEAENTVEGMRSRLFPPDSSLEQEKLARLVDRRLDANQRRNALNDLLQRSTMSPTARTSADPAVIRGAVDLATTAADPAMRESVWRRLRDVQRNTVSADLIAPAARALGTETDEKVRLELVTILAADRSGIAAARAALESVAQSDPRQLVRMAAQRGLTGDAGWNEYVLATMKNAELTATQRLEPFAYMSSASLPTTQLALDDAALRTLGGLLSRMEEFSAGANGALNALTNARTPGARDVMIGLLRPDDGRSPVAPSIRWTVMNALVRNFPDDPRARGLVEEIAASDPDPEQREIAQRALNMADPRKLMQELLQKQQFQQQLPIQAPR